MKSFSSRPEQVADILRQGMMSGRWRKVLPGRDKLATDLDCSHWTVEEAMRLLAAEGVLVSQGPGKRRRIELSAISNTRTLNIRILLYESSDRKTDYLVELVHKLQQAGHEAGFAERTMHDMGMKLEDIIRYAGQVETDAWVVVAGPREVLQWFSSQPTPAFALFGRLLHVPIASTSPKKADALLELVDRLVELGHRRIVKISREERRQPHPGFLEKLFLDRLSMHGITTGTYHLPDWEATPAGLHEILDSLCSQTPATALIIDEPPIYFAAMQHLANMGMVAPRDISMACMDPCPQFNWCQPKITHLEWDSKPIVGRVLRWAGNISRGKDDLSKTSTVAKLVIGGTIGPAPMRD